MARRRSNPDLWLDPKLSLSPDEIEKGKSSYFNWHWGIPPRRVVDWDDPDMPRMLVECGRLIRIHIRLPNSQKHPLRQRDSAIELSHKESKRSYVAYDPNHPHERLYLLASPRIQKMMKERFWDENDISPLDLNQLAEIAGGRHGKRRDYPHLSVKPIGIVTAIIYFCEKMGDGTSYYIHQVAEITGKHPILSVDGRGRLWLAGGNYTVPTPGITD